LSRDEPPLDSRTAAVAPELVAELRRAREGQRPTSLLVYHRDGTSVLSLAPDQPIVVGREAPSDLVLLDRSLSRQHVRFTLVDGVVWVEDLGSTNGTRLNGETITKARLRPGDEVSLGAVLASLHQVRAPRGPLLGHDELLDALELEVQRAKALRRSFVLAILRARGKEPFTRWVPLLAEAIRPIDRMARSSPAPRCERSPKRSIASPTRWSPC
jgi:two-component system, NtrC family, response regulator AtoC